MKRKDNKQTALLYEKHVANLLRLQGFRNVELTKRSGDFGADILCVDIQGNTCAIQCKYYSGHVGYKAVEEALAGARYYSCMRALLVTNNKYTKSAIKGANKLGVELFICPMNS